jgi:alkylation response protein AidB-like acyl-CoA dehydrogenase
MIADLSTRLEAARLLTYRAAALKRDGASFSLAASQAKLFASRTAVEAADTAVQIHGGYGYIEEYPVERLYRDAKATELYEGTSEIQRLVIARHLLRDSVEESRSREVEKSRATK